MEYSSAYFIYLVKYPETMLGIAECSETRLLDEP